MIYHLILNALFYKYYFYITYKIKNITLIIKISPGVNLYISNIICFNT